MLRVIGKLRYIDSTPYDFIDRESKERVTGTTHKARVEQGRGRAEDVKIREDHLGTLPADASIPEEGIDVDWDVEIVRGVATFFAPHVERTHRAPLSAAKTS